MSNYYNDQWRLPNEENKSKQSNYSMDFDSARVNLGTSLDLGINSTISFWINAETFGGNMFLSETSYQYGYFMYMDGSNIILVIGSSSPKYYTHSMVVGQWYHLVIVRQGTSIEIFQNNTSLGTQTGFGTTVNTKFDTFGGKTTGGYAFNGLIDGMSAFNYALSSSQITTLYGSSSTGIGNPMSLSPKPVAYYPLGDQDAFNGASYLTPNASLKDFVFDFELNTASSADEYISIFPNNELNGLTNVTFAGWFYARATNVYDGIYSNRSSGGYVLIYPDFVTTNTFRIRAVTQANGVTSYVHSDYVSINQWYHFALVCENGSTLKIYINGEDAVYTSGTNFSSIVQTTFFKIGSDGGTRNWNGFFSNFQVWDTNLSSTDAETLYNNGSPLQNLNDIPQNSNLKAWWKLDASATYDSSTTTWTIPDDSTNSNTGTSSGMTQANLVQSDLSFTSGYSPYALDFDAASGDRINFTGLPDFGGGSLTVSFWIKSGVDANNAYVLMRSGFSFYIFQAGTASNLRYRIQTSSLNNINGGAILDNNWHHCVMTFDSTANEFKVFEDGVQVSSTVTTSGSLASSTSTVYLASFAGGAPFKSGSFSNFSIWNAALTSSQVTEIYNEGVPSNLNNHSAYSNLVSWWQLGSNSSFNTNWTVLDEVTASGNNGTSVNMTEDAIVDGVGSYANGLSSGMGGDEVIGSAPFSDANSLSINMDVLDRVEDTPA